jgi:hypothetical protein
MGKGIIFMTRLEINAEAVMIKPATHISIDKTIFIWERLFFLLYNGDTALVALFLSFKSVYHRLIYGLQVDRLAGCFQVLYYRPDREPPDLLSLDHSLPCLALTESAKNITLPSHGMSPVFSIAP